ncbi:transglutaminase N-terminal domain-containing protein [Litorivivens sp.]|uniref:transglutaminase family protein n=3 Tax=Litorivivens sp. TaxID=2020868 RepID=UPI003563AA6E
MKYKIKHTTHYRYSSQVSMCFNEARLTPLNNAHQSCSKNQFTITPAPEVTHSRVDYYGNQVTSFDILTPHRELVVTVQSEVQVSDHSQDGLFYRDHTWEYVRDTIQSSRNGDLLELREYILNSPLIPETLGIREYAELSFQPKRPLLDAVMDLNQRIFTEFKYDPQSTTISTPLEDVLKNRHGVCQDFAHLGIACLRAMGLPAAYVSGYLETLPPPGEEKLEGSDASHAWLAVYMPDYGWMQFDPTNNLMVGEQHIMLGFGRDFADVSPLKGVIYGGDAHTLSVSVDVARQIE